MPTLILACVIVTALALPAFILTMVFTSISVNHVPAHWSRKVSTAMMFVTMACLGLPTLVILFAEIIARAASQ